MSRIDPDLDQAQQHLDERRALLPRATGANAAQVRADIARLEAAQQQTQQPHGGTQ